MMPAFDLLTAFLNKQINNINRMISEQLIEKPVDDSDNGVIKITFLKELKKTTEYLRSGYQGFKPRIAPSIIPHTKQA
jgi:hypothetical protein